RYVSPDLPRLLAIAVLSVVVLSYAAMTVRQNTLRQSSERLWENTVARYPNSSPGNVNLAVIYIGQGRYEAAQELCLNAVRALPYDYLAISNLALAQVMMGQYDNAIHNYRTALRLRPDLYKARFGMANAYWAKRDYAQAFQAYTSTLRTNPHLENSFYGGLILSRLGYAAWKLGKGPESDAYLARAARLTGTYPAVLQELAGVYTSMGNDVLALKAYQDLLKVTNDGRKQKELQERIQALRP
ncbi:MAG TPA: tetratricopeptide repeat protein, partial [Deltaproteobacteria bacterium]|nr:tetratricopeptide repeat protein [Deltaproteobacteria bacterium]